MNFKLLISILVCQTICAHTILDRTFGLLPAFSESDLDQDGCISLIEYSLLSQALLRRAAPLFEVADNLQAEGQRSTPRGLDGGAPTSLTGKATLPSNHSYLLSTKRKSQSTHKSRKLLEVLLTMQPSGASGSFVSPELSGDKGLQIEAESARLPGSAAHIRGGRGLQNCEDQDTHLVEECSWLNHTGMDDVLLCNDGTYCYPLEDEASWGCCKDRGKRAQCPSNWGQMCAVDYSCGGASDYCCEVDCDPLPERPCFAGCTDAAKDSDDSEEPALWSDSELETCEDYFVYEYCNGTDGYGPGWADRKSGTFETYVVDGMTAQDACCACGGGIIAPPPLPSPPPVPPPSPPTPPALPPLPLAPPVSVDGSSVTLYDATYAFPQLNGVLQDANITLILLQINVTLTEALVEIRRAVSILGQCQSEDGSAVRCHISGGGAYRIFRLGYGAAVHLEALELLAGRADSDGGALHVVHARVTLVDCVLRDSVAEGSGAAVYAYRSHVACQACHLRGNVAELYGGAIWGVNESVVVLDGGTLVEGNACKDATVGVSSQSRLIVNGTSRVVGNTAKGYGGGLGGHVFSVLQVDGGSVLEGNKATGGAGLLLRESSTAVISGASLLHGNWAKDAGGGFNCLDGYNSISFTQGSLVTGNVADALAGAGMHSSSGTFVADGGSIISGNSAVLDGGGLYVRYANCDVTLKNMTLCGNEAGMSGGGVYMKDADSSLYVTESLLCNNSAGEGEGGAIYSSSSVNLTQGTVVKNNTAAAADGGAVYMASYSTLVLSEGSAVIGNFARRGGGFYTTTRTKVAVLNRSTVERNVATYQGGGVFTETRGAVVVDGESLVQDNTVNASEVDTGGGGIYLGASAMLSITGNSSVRRNDGGPIGTGGGLHAGEGCIVRLINASVAENKASDGGGVYAGKNASVRLNRCTLAGNVASTRGGGISSGLMARLEVTGQSAVLSNVAEGYGGGISCSDLMVKDSEISMNAASTGGESPGPALISCTVPDRGYSADALCEADGASAVPFAARLVVRGRWGVH
ncbi:hypothetical protein CYMTET_53250, partial [Cymbomonas tetramitiformis]